MCFNSKRFMAVSISRKSRNSSPIFRNAAVSMIPGFERIRVLLLPHYNQPPQSWCCIISDLPANQGASRQNKYFLNVGDSRLYTHFVHLFVFCFWRCEMPAKERGPPTTVAKYPKSAQYYQRSAVKTLKIIFQAKLANLGNLAWQRFARRLSEQQVWRKLINVILIKGITYTNHWNFQEQLNRPQSQLITRKIYLKYAGTRKTERFWNWY